MNKDTKVIMKKKLNITDLSGEKVMVDFETGKYFLIKGAGNDIWDMIQVETTPGEIIEKLMQEYEVSREECERSVYEFLEQLQKLNFID